VLYAGGARLPNNAMKWTNPHPCVSAFGGFWRRGFAPDPSTLRLFDIPEPTLERTPAPLEVRARTGAEAFHHAGTPLGFDLLGFWRWSASNLVSNALRGRLAEFLVSQALGISDSVRSEWDAFDLRTPAGVTIEVKSAAYLQTWAQRAPSAISFDIRPTRSWDPLRNEFAIEARRQAEIYVLRTPFPSGQGYAGPTEPGAVDVLRTPHRNRGCSTSSAAKAGPFYAAEALAGALRLQGTAGGSGTCGDIFARHRQSAGAGTFSRHGA
jgi:hypothetical protein